MNKVFNDYRISISIPKIHLSHSTRGSKVSWSSGGTKGTSIMIYSLYCSKKPNAFAYKNQARLGCGSLERERVGERLNSLWCSMPVDDSFKNISRDMLSRCSPVTSF